MLRGKIYSVSGILIDVMRLVFRRTAGTIPTGIDRVSLAYVQHYGDRARAVLSLGPLAAAVSPADSARLFRKLLDGGNGIALLGVEMAAKASFWNWIKPGTGNSILFNTGNLWVDSRFYAAQLRWLGARPVFFVHDLIPSSHPEYFRPGEGREHLARVRNFLSIARGIIVNSLDTQTALARYAQAVGLPCPSVVVAPLAPSVAASPAPGPRPIDQPYFVVLGTIEPRKNHLLLLQLWRQFAGKQGASAPRLFVIGQRGWECENVVDLLERCEPLKGVVFERNNCGDAELANLLHHAQALLMPSFVEGFGLPVVEALAAGVPVIASDLPVFREIAAEIPEYADPIDGARWMELILDYTRPNSSRRRAQLARIAGNRPTTWPQHFEIVDRFLETLP